MKKDKHKPRQWSDNELAVLAFLKNMKQYSPDNFSYLNYYGASAREMIKFMEHPEQYGNMDFLFVCDLFRAIEKTFHQYVKVRAEIPAPTEEERILASLLTYAEKSFLSAYTNNLLFNKNHFISYLTRDKIIYQWNDWLIICMQEEVKKIITEMQVRLDIAV